MSGNDDPDCDGADTAESGDAGADEGDDGPLPTDVVDRAERLTRRAREAVDDAEADAYRADRADLLDAHDYTARVRADDGGDVLVLHPAEWVEDGTVRFDRVEDLDRGIERSLSGPAETDDWSAVEARNREVARAVAGAHGDPHGATAHALADFAGNHYAKAIEALTGEELREFREDYLPRNAWPSDAQREALDESLRLTFAATDASLPRDASE